MKNACQLPEYLLNSSTLTAQGVNGIDTTAVKTSTAKIVQHNASHSDGYMDSSSQDTGSKAHKSTIKHSASHPKKTTDPTASDNKGQTNLINSQLSSPSTELKVCKNQMSRV